MMSSRVDHHKAEETRNKTFRLKLAASNLLDQEAGDRGLSDNVIINELILKDLRRERGLRSLKPIQADSLTIRLLAEEVSEEKIVEIGEKTANDVLLRDVPFEVTGSMSSESIVQTMKLYYDCSESKYSGRRILIVAHYAGSKWSLLVGTFWKTLLASVGSDVKFSIDDNAVVFEFES